MKFDLHIHSCLSPCANLEMSPGEIVARAKAAGMDGIALTDHQSARNCPAIAECADKTYHILDGELLTEGVKRKNAEV